MQIIEKLYKNDKPLYPIERFCDTKRALFIDIETTGLKKETTSLYLIGCGYYKKEGFFTKLFFADNESEEKEILLLFSEFVKDYTHLFHFNGLKFDIPYLEYKAEKYGLCGLFSGITQIDVYRLCAPLRFLLFPTSMRQKMIESFLGIGREDMYTGGELIEVYHDYQKSKSDEALTLLITHNREDVLGMHLIMPILYYLDLKDAPLSYRGYRTEKYNDYNGKECSEVIFEYTTNVFFPRSFFAKTESMYVKADHDTGRILIRLPIYEEELKIYYENYREYCYIPEEDRAVLKTIAATLPKNRYRKATKEECYSRISGTFLKQPDGLFKPVLKTSLKDKRKFFRFPEDFDEKAAEQFGRMLINIFFTMKRR